MNQLISSVMNEMITLATDVFRVRCIPPSGSFDGKSNVSIITPFFSPFIPKIDTVFEVREMPGTSMPVSYFSYSSSLIF
jgi:hypothetical protein